MNDDDGTVQALTVSAEELDALSTAIECVMAIEDRRAPNDTGAFRRDLHAKRVALIALERRLRRNGNSTGTARRPESLP